MRAFACSHCGQLLFFENSHCLRCGSTLGFEPGQLELKGIEPQARSRYTLVGEKDGTRYKRCARTQLACCNWLLEADDPEELCPACRLTPQAPVLKSDEQLRAFAQAESNKRRLMYQLYDLGLPVISRDEDPLRGLEFLLAFQSGDRPVMTGHLDGVITLDLSECDNVHRERLRHEFGEPYRTLLGHFRHEIGHYYWNVLIDGREAQERFRELFGDDRLDYSEALRRNYEQPHNYWQASYVSAYAASHPWEDWAETFAHYLHIRDTLQTAANFGLRVAPAAQTIPPAGGKLVARANEDVMQEDFEAVVAEWLPLTYAFNAANRSMGKEDLYPFVLAPAVIEKLSFVHDLVRAVQAVQDLRLDVEVVEVRAEVPPEEAAVSAA